MVIMKNRVIFAIMAVCLCQSSLLASVKEIGLDNFNAEILKASPGDTLLISEGVYKNLMLNVTAHGTAQNPIVVKAKQPGTVIISGTSRMSISGEWIVIDGLFFNDGHAPSGKPVIEFRNGEKRAFHCRLTNCVIDSFNPKDRNDSYNNVELFGRYNRVDHNSFTGKRNHGVTLVVSLYEDVDRENFHMIDHNYFGPRSVYASNGAETIRMGLAQHCKFHCNTTLTQNWFDRCNGEVECVSIKSSDITISNNLFTQCEGVLALRHGDRNIVDGNMWIGDNIRNTGGIRVVNAGHTIKNNYLEGLAGYRFFAALALMNAVPNSLPNRYEWVKDLDICNNTFVDCVNLECGTGCDMERTLPPSDIRFHDNTIYNSGNGSDIFFPYSDMSGILKSDNKLIGKKPERPVIPVSKDEVGAPWYKLSDRGENSTNHNVVTVLPGQDNLCVALSNATDGEVFELAEPGEYFLSSTLDIHKKVTIRAKADLSSKPVIRYNSTKSGPMFRICDNGCLEVKGLVFNGDQLPYCALANSAITSSSVMNTSYSLYVDDCEFFGSTGLHAIVGTKNTFASVVRIVNSKFYDLCYTAIDYSSEKDDKGRYNADDIIIDNCVFFHILNVGVNIYRGGSDESTAGPYVTVTNCTFDDVCNMERGSALRLIGPQVMLIENCNFNYSGRGGFSIRLDEASWEKIRIHNCNFYNSGKVLTMTNKVIDGPIYDIKPEFCDPAAKNFMLKPDSPLVVLGVNTTPIGIR